ncbi:sigma-70 family RNA polymerase sigma factor [Pontiellaceae bacterium B12227]|nr:sigma-70 family RNA polymerase sigma factor [Pontiellaceae bacterium B12227]
MPEAEQFIMQFTRHERQIRYYIASLVTNKSDVDDIMQEASSLLWKKYDQFDPERPFLPWAMKFAYNAVRTYRQKLGTRRKYFSNELIEELAAVHEKEMDRLDQERRLLPTALQKLSEKERLLIQHRYSSGGTIQDLAETLGEKPDALYKRLQRIREKLMTLIQLELETIS